MQKNDNDAAKLNHDSVVAERSHQPRYSTDQNSSHVASTTSIESPNAAIQETFSISASSKGKGKASDQLQKQALKDRQSTQPVLVNPGVPLRNTMHLPMSPQSFYRSSTRTKPQPPVHSPTPSAFSISSILSSLQTDDSTQADIDAIAEIYGKSRLSMANEYASHRTPIGSGPDIIDLEDDEGRATPVLSLDTNLHHSNNLETVEELPTPLSDRSRREAQFDAYGSKTTSTSAPSTSPAASTEYDEPPDLLSVWQIRAMQTRASARSIAGISKEVEARGSAESYLVQPHADLRDDISGSGGSRAVRELLKVSGNR